MKRKQSPFDAKSVKYLRPDQPYQCGLNNLRCDAGPTADGKCSRPDSPCTPVASEGLIRKRIFRRVTVLALGLSLLALAADDIAVFDPGTHRSFHAHLDCSSCHAPLQLTSLTSLQRGLWGSGSPHASMKCLKCHDMGEFGDDPHSVSPEYLRFLTDDRSLTSNPLEDVSCGQCHLEHRIQDEMVHLNDVRCQSCHQQRFASFDDGHPEFNSTYGQPERAIAFDHRDHASKHFNEFPQHAPQTCDDCHSLAPDRSRMILKPFAESCAPCHSDSISGHAATGKQKGIEFLSIPSFDLESLSQADKDIKPWPDIGSDFPTAWTLRWLRDRLGGDSDVELLSGVELYDLEDQSEPILAASKRVALRFKDRLQKTLESDLESFVNSIVSGSSTPGPDLEQISLLSGQLPRSILEQASTRWFTPVTESSDSTELPEQSNSASEQDVDLSLLEDDLLGTEEEDDLSRMEADDASSEPTDPDDIDLELWASAGGWYFEPPSIRYRPVQHADPFIKAWVNLEVMSTIEDPDSESIIEQVFGPLAAGNCASCHIGIKREEATAHWSPTSMRPETFPQPTHFSHGPHILPGSSVTCLNCHQLLDDNQLSNDWKPITRSSCTSCHGQEVQSNCSTCHDYHVGPRTRLINAVDIDGLIQPQED